MRRIKWIIETGSRLSARVVSGIVAKNMYGNERRRDRFSGFKDESGMGTVEIVIIIAVLVGLALIFRDAILGFAQQVMKAIFANDEITKDVEVDSIRDGFGVK